jgi:hypothetical protein
MIPKKFYHGTVSTFVPKILDEGLKPIDANRWNATIDFNGYNPDQEDPHGLVYLLDYGTKALKYAMAKARYFRAKPGEMFDGVNGLSMVKGAGAPVIVDAEPVVLELSLPETLADLLEDDSKDSDAYEVKGIIPASAIRVADLEKVRHSHRSHESEQRATSREIDHILSALLLRGLAL